jgi:hypothetical protein
MDAHFADLLRIVKVIDNATVISVLQGGDLARLEALFLTMKPKTYRLTKTIPHCKNILQVEILLREKEYKMKRTHNELLITLRNDEIVEFLVNHHTRSLNPGYKDSMPLRFAVKSGNVARVRTFLLSMRCNIHSSDPSTGKTIIQDVLERRDDTMVKLFAIVYDKQVAANVGYTRADFEAIDSAMANTRATMCLEQYHARCELKRMVDENRTKLTREQIVDAAVVNGIFGRVGNDLLCVNQQVRRTRELVCKWFQLPSSS